MSNNTITKEQIDKMMSEARVVVNEIFGKCTIVSAQFKNGFIITESSACVDPKNYDVEMGKSICLKRIENKLWELMGYHLQQKLYEENN